MRDTLFEERGKWVKHNLYDGVVYYRLCRRYKIDKLGGYIMDYIGSWCDRGQMTYNQEDNICYLSYEDIAYMYEVTKSMAATTVSKLLKHNLIERVNVRKGKSKSGYKLNLSLITQEKNKYLNANEIDKENG